MKQGRASVDHKVTQKLFFFCSFIGTSCSLFLLSLTCCSMRTVPTDKHLHVADWQNFSLYSWQVILVTTTARTKCFISFYLAHLVY